MKNLGTLDKLQQQLCELKLEERRVCSDIRILVRANSTIDFFQYLVCLGQSILALKSSIAIDRNVFFIGKKH